MISFDDLENELSTFELRFEPTFMLWDRAGTIWTMILDAVPDLKLSSVLPNQQVFETEDLQLVLELSVLRVNARGEKSLKTLIRSASALTDLATEILKIHSFKRAGFRTIHWREFPSIDTALKYVGDHGPGQSGALGKQAIRKALGHSNRFESETAGIQSALRVEEREWNFTVPWESRPHLTGVSLSHKKWHVVVDNDYYTIGLVDRESFDVATWVDQAWNAIQAQWRSAN